MENTDVRLNTVEQTLAAVQTDVTSLKGTVAKHEGELDEVRNDGIRMAVILDKLEETVRVLSQTVNELRAIPARKWDSAINQVIALCIAAAVGFIFSQIGL